VPSLLRGSCRIPTVARGAAFVSAAAGLAVIGAPWTTGTVAIGTASAMGRNEESVGPNVDWNLVTAIVVSTS
jgi:hypothetical protein